MLCCSKRTMNNRLKKVGKKERKKQRRKREWNKENIANIKKRCTDVHDLLGHLLDRNKLGL